MADPQRKRWNRDYPEGRHFTSSRDYPEGRHFTSSTLCQCNFTFSGGASQILNATTHRSLTLDWAKPIEYN
jgi:hypothetical protein